jgi:hypothetical protein
MELECADLPFQAAIITDGRVVHEFRIQCAHRIFHKSFLNGHRGSAAVPIAAMCQHAICLGSREVGDRTKPTALVRCAIHSFG